MPGKGIACACAHDSHDGLESGPGRPLCYIEQGHRLFSAFRKLVKLEPFVKRNLCAASGLGGIRLQLLALERNESINSHIDS